MVQGYGWWYPRWPHVRPAWMSANPLLADGSVVPSADIDMNHKKLTGLGAPVSANDAARLIDISTPDYLAPPFTMGIYKDWSQATPAWSYCDGDGAPYTPPSGWQSTHPILKNIRTCVVNASGAVAYGSNNRGDGLNLTGASGQVMVEFPSVYSDRWMEGDFEFMVFSPVEIMTAGGRSLTKSPAYYACGGWERSKIYVSRYYAGLGISAANELCAISASGKQPWTGQEMVGLDFTGGIRVPLAGEILSGATSLRQGTVVAVKLSSGAWDGSAAGTIYLKLVDEKLTFNTGSVEFVVGQTVTGASSGATGTIVAVVVSSGSWGGGDAAGHLVIRGGNGLNYTNAETLTGSGGGSAKATSTSLGDVKAAFTSLENLQIAGDTVAVANGTGSILGLTCQNLNDYAKAYAGGDTRWGCIDPYTNDLLTMLAYLDLGTCDIQSLSSVGSGVTGKSWTRLFGGANNGADSIDSNVDIWGTGKGTGSAGMTPNMWRGLQDFLGGNVYGFVIGIQGNNAGVWNIINPNGQFVPTSPLTAGSFISTIGSCLLSDGYWDKSLNEAAAKWLLLPADVTGSSATKRCDYYYYPRYAQTVLRVGGLWYDGANAGVGDRNASHAASNSARYVGGRLVFRP